MLTNANKTYNTMIFTRPTKFRSHWKKVWCTVRRNTYVNIMMDS